MCQSEDESVDARHGGRSKTRIFLSSNEIRGSVVRQRYAQDRDCRVVPQDARVQGAGNVLAIIACRDGSSGGVGRVVVWGVIVFTKYAGS